MFFFLLLTLASLVNPYHAAAGRTVRVGVYETKPLAYSDTDGSARGFFVDMLNRVAKSEQWSMQYVPGTWQEGLDRLKSDKIDIVLCIAYTEAREKYMDFPKEYLLLDWGLIFKSKGTKISSLLDLEGKSVSALRGDVYLTGFRELVRQFNVNVKIQEVDQYPDVFKAVESGAVAAGVNGNLYGMLNDAGLNLEQTPIIFTPVKLGYAVNKGKNGDLIAVLDRHIAEMKADKASLYHRELEQLLGKKGNVIPKEAYWMIFGTVVALIFAIALNVLLKRQVRAKTEHLEAEIAERKKDEEILTHERNRAQGYLDTVETIIVSLDTEGRITTINRKACQILGYGEDGLLGQCWFNTCLPQPEGPEVVYPHFLELMAGKREGSEYLENYIVTKSGELRQIAWHNALLRDEQGRIYGTLSAGEDITERKKAEQTLQYERNLSVDIINAQPAGIYRIRVFAPDTWGDDAWRSSESSPHVVELASEPFCKILGTTKETFENNPGMIIDLIHPDDREGFARKNEEVAVHHEEFTWEGRLLIDGEIRWVRFQSLPRPLENGDVLWTGALIDITDRITAEEEKNIMQSKLQQTQKLESLGVLAGGIAHDFNNILTSIVGNADLALMKINPDSPAIDNLRRIENAAGKAADLAKQMLAYSGKGRFIIESLDMNRLLEEMLHMLEVSISKKAVLRLNLTPNLPPVEADATQIRQILMNLVINASEAVSERSGVIAISTGCVDCNRNYLNDVWLNGNLNEGLYVYLEIADTGCGMDKDTLSKIFDPFFTTKFTGRGLGMSAVLGIVRGHKGAINVYSEAGKGTTFKILLPASGKLAEIYHHDSQTDDWHGSGTVLLVDDEETVRGIGREMLHELGFTTVTANDGREAINVFKQNPDITFVLLDLTMPHMDGERCFKELRQIKPDVKVIMSSGFSEYEVTPKFTGKGLAGFIQKPYKLSVLREVIQKI